MKMGNLLMPPFYMGGGKDRNGKKKSGISNFPGAEKKLNDGYAEKVQAEMARQEALKKQKKEEIAITKNKDGLMTTPSGVVIPDMKESTNG